MDAPRAAGKRLPSIGWPAARGLVRPANAVLQDAPVPTTETQSRCRHCGAPLAGEKRRRRCLRCHPERATSTGAQLDLFSPPAPVVLAVAAPELVEVAAVPNELPPPAEPMPAPGSVPAWPLRPRRSPLSYLKITAGSLIVIAGLSWGGFQLWPRGSVERSIVQAFAAQPRFEERTGAANPFHGVAVEAESSAAFADLNGDGAPDLVLGSRSGDFRVYRNAGTAGRARFLRPAADTSGLVPTDTSNAVAFADLRGVHLPDAVNAGANGVPTYFQNRGDRDRADFVLLAPEDDPLAFRAAPARSYDWRPVFADIDRDGDFDLFVGTRDGTVLFFENHGTARKPDFGVVTRVNPFGLRGAGELLSLAFGDLDGDGDLDALATNAPGEIRYFENRGTATRPKFLLTPPGALGLTGASPEATVALFDADADGDLDCVTGGAAGRLRYFENLRAPAH